MRRARARGKDYAAARRADGAARRAKRKVAARVARAERAAWAASAAAEVAGILASDVQVSSFGAGEASAAAATANKATAAAGGTAQVTFQGLRTILFVLFAATLVASSAAPAATVNFASAPGVLVSLVLVALAVAVDVFYTELSGGVIFAEAPWLRGAPAEEETRTAARGKAARGKAARAFFARARARAKKAIVAPTLAVPGLWAAEWASTLLRYVILACCSVEGWRAGPYVVVAPRMDHAKESAAGEPGFKL